MQHTCTCDNTLELCIMNCDKTIMKFKKINKCVAWENVMKHFEDLHLIKALHPKHVHYNFNIPLSSPMMNSEHSKIKTSCKHIDNIIECTIVTL